MTSINELEKRIEELERLVANGIWQSKVTVRDIADFIERIEEMLKK